MSREQKNIEVTLDTLYQKKKKRAQDIGVCNANIRVYLPPTKLIAFLNAKTIGIGYSDNIFGMI
jgi:hypothetical protein